MIQIISDIKMDVVEDATEIITKGILVVSSWIRLNRHSFIYSICNILS